MRLTIFCATRLWVKPAAWMLAGLVFWAGVCTADAGCLPSAPVFYEKEKLTIAVTDSGLGGLSVVADAAEKLKAYKGFARVDLIFVNALFSNQGGYNTLAGKDEKAAVFNAAMTAIEARFRPDMILIGCNTLSVVYPDTGFARTSATPVQGIVDNGVDLIAGRLKDSGSGRCILFGTQTTVAAGIHKQKLMDMGIRADRITYQACPELTLFIEQGFDSPETGMLVQAYVEEALAGLKPGTGPLYASFNCTHYGYADSLWRQAFEAAGTDVAAFLNPNTVMADSLLHPAYAGWYPSVDLGVRVVSMVDIPQDRIQSISRCLAPISRETAAALAGYEQVPALFAWQHLVKGRDN